MEMSYTVGTALRVRQGSEPVFARCSRTGLKRSPAGVFQDGAMSRTGSVCLNNLGAVRKQTRVLWRLRQLSARAPESNSFAI
jgi:hypothetical protein